MSTPHPPRGGLVRQALLYTPLFLLCLGGLLAMVSGGVDGGPLLPLFAVVGSFLFGYQAFQALRDLRAAPTFTSGPVTRIWSKMDFFVTRSYYITVRRAIFRIPVQAYWDLREEAKRMRADGTDEDYRIEVRVGHFPHTGNVLSVERTGVVRIGQPEAPERAAAEGSGGRPERRQRG